MVKLFGKYNFPEGLYYSKDHMWAQLQDGHVKVGLTDFGQQIAGKILMLRGRPVGKLVNKDKILGTMETGKWVGPLRAPVSGTIIEFNEILKNVSAADIVNKDPYGEGWMFILDPSNLQDELKELMSELKAIEEWLKEEIEKLEIKK